MSELQCYVGWVLGVSVQRSSAAVVPWIDELPKVHVATNYLLTMVHIGQPAGPDLMQRDVMVHHVYDILPCLHVHYGKGLPNSAIMYDNKDYGWSQDRPSPITIIDAAVHRPSRGNSVLSPRQ